MSVGPSEFQFAVRVYYEDTDAAGIVYHANFLKYMERARTEWLRRLGFEQDDLARRFSIAFVVRDTTLEFLRPARFNDLLTATCQITRCGRASIEFAQEVRNVGTVLCRGAVRVGCVNYRAMVPLRMPDEIFMRVKDAG